MLTSWCFSLLTFFCTNIDIRYGVTEEFGLLSPAYLGLFPSSATPMNYGKLLTLFLPSFFICKKTSIILPTP